MNAAKREREKYERVWEGESYRKADHSSEVWAEYCAHRHLGIAGIRVIDFGCGVGRLVDHLNEVGIDAHGVDIAHNSVDQDIKKKWWTKFFTCPLWEMSSDLVGTFDIGVCADVMEHIPEELVVESFSRIVQLSHTTFFLIEGVLDYAGRQGGEPLHLTVRPQEWWVEMAERVGKVTVLPKPTRYPRPTAHFITLEP